MPKPAKIEAEKVIGTKNGETKRTFTQKDAILYALGIGFSTDPMRQADYKYTNQSHEQFTAFSTYGCMVADFNPISILIQHPNMPNFSPFIILHAEQKLVLVKDQILPGTEYTSEQQVVDVLDKGKNALVVFRTNSYVDNEGKKQLAFYNQMTLLLRGFGGFGFKGKGVTSNIPKVPESKPDHILQATSFPGQAFIYRLSGDYNPLHIDPNISAIQKFDKPIIHGLASYGIVARAISQQLLDNDDRRIKSYHARFIGHVFPGETYEIQIWKNGNKWIFLASVVERKTKALVGQIEIKPQAKL